MDTITAPVFDISFVTPYLAVGSLPKKAEYAYLKNIGVKLIINMIFFRGNGSSCDLPVLRLRSFDNPFAPLPLGAMIRGAEAGVALIRQQEKIFVHCMRGRHRSPAMAAAILIALGYSLDDAIAMIKKARPVARPDTLYIKRRIIAFEKIWRNRQLTAMQ